MYALLELAIRLHAHCVIFMTVRRRGTGTTLPTLFLAYCPPAIHRQSG
jgi:hypothetical protein